LAVAAFTTNNGAAKVKEDAVTARNLVESRMASSGKCQVISREEIDALLENQRIQVGGISSKENIAKLQLRNIRYIVTGSVNAVDSDYLITVKILDVSTGRFSHSADEFMGGISQEMSGGVSALTDKFIAGIGSEEMRLVQADLGASGGRSYKIGDTGPGGGIVFLIERDVSFEVSGSLGSYTWEEAKRVAKDFRGGGCSDWRLPSREELNFIYKNLQGSRARNLGNDWYWSSSQANTLDAWNQRFSDGKQFNANKNYRGNVLAVRTF
jgi:hypothetical protein